MFVLLLNLFDIVPGSRVFAPYVLPHQYDAWMGFLRSRSTGARSCGRSGSQRCFAVPSAFAGYVVFMRRDVAGG